MSKSGSLATFRKALEAIPVKEKKHVLLGNGFSQACRKDIFSYGSLLEKADFSKLSKTAKGAFETLATTDFEAVIKALVDAAKLVTLYKKSDRELAKSFQGDAEKLKTLLVETISKHHPADPGNITEDEFKCCRAFLRHFDRIYSLNYDLLLYWTLMHRIDGEGPKEELRSDDGFRHPEEGESAPYVTWEIENTYEQTVHYLHGALHLFTSETELKKFTWSRTGVKLMSQINTALENEMYPMIVAEGSSDQKKGRIMKSGYLQRSLKSLSSIGGALFVYGLSFSENDDHILRMIKKSRIHSLWVSIYGDPNTKNNKLLMSRTRILADARPPTRKLVVNFFDAESANVWRYGLPPT